jgi:hypothetical protein
MFTEFHEGTAGGTIGGTMTSTTADPFFANVVDEQIVLPSSEQRLRLPLRYQESSTFTAHFLAPTAVVQEALPSLRLRPHEVELGRVLVSVTAFNHRRSDLAPYHELGVFIPATYQADREPEVVTGAYCLTLPVTTEEARVAGSDAWGFPKYVADIVIEESEIGCRCEVSAEGQPIVTFEVGAVAVAEQPERQELPMLTVHGNELLHIPVVSEGRRGRRDDGEGTRLILGDHPRAAILRQLQLGPAVAQSRSLQAKALLPAADRRVPLDEARIDDCGDQAVSAD